MLAEFTSLGNERLFWHLLRLAVAFAGLTGIFKDKNPFGFESLKIRGPQGIQKLILVALGVVFYGYRAVAETRVELIPQLAAVALVAVPLGKYTSPIAKFLLSTAWVVESLIGNVERRPLDAKVNFIAQLVLVVLISISRDPPVSQETSRRGLKSFFDRATLSVLSKALKSAYKHGTFQREDLPEEEYTFDSEAAALIFEKNLKGPVDRNLLLKALWVSFYPSLIKSYAFQVTRYLLELSRPYLLKKLIYFIDQRYQSQEPSLKYGIGIAFAIYIDTLIATEVAFFEAFEITDLHSRVCAALESIIYKKSQRLSRQSRETYLTGKIIQLISGDADKIAVAARRAGELVTSPAQLLLCLFSLWSLVGSALLGNFVILGLFIPLNAYVLKIITRRMKIYRELRDRLGEAIADLYSSMKLLKLYTWENVLMKKVIDLKENEEIPANRSRLSYNRLANFFWLLQPFLVSFTTLTVYTWFSKKQLTAEIIFPTLALLKILAVPVTKIPQLLSVVLGANISLEKVASFLATSELEGRVTSNDSDNAVEVKGSFVWSKLEEAKSTALSNINLSVKKGEFVTLVGRVGSGKSALLGAILGELETQSTADLVVVNGLVAYVSQTPWILNGTLRDNILFGNEFQEDTYNTILEASQLKSDIDKFPEKDYTLVGEKGVSLSGGQKARVSLARALYSGADIYIIDDVLSAVDNHVGKKLIQEVFVAGGVLSGKTIIFATNNVQVLSHSSSISYLEDGQIVEQASYKEGKANQGSKLQELLATDEPEVEGKVIPTLKPISKVPTAVFDYNPLERHFLTYKGKITEQTSKGRVLKSVYIGYLKACSVVPVSLVVILSVVTSGLRIGTDLWLKKWAEDDSQEQDKTWHYITGYALLGFSFELILGLRSWLLLVVVGFDAAKNIFVNMTKGLVGTSIRFFDKTPRGRILSKYSTDIARIETVLPKSIFTLLTNLSAATLSIAALVYASPAVVPVLLILSLILWHYQSIYLVANREYRRLSGVTGSPLISLLQESLEGAETIRAYGQTERFTKIIYADNDFEIRVATFGFFVARWLLIRLQFLTSTIALFTSLYFVFSSGPGLVSGGTAGFALSYAVGIIDSLRGITGAFGSLDGELVPVERCLEYVNLEPEEEAINGVEPSKDWLSNGEVTFNNYSATYDLVSEPVLQNISLSFKPGEKIGVVGRTGAGKSSLILALFRMLKIIEGDIAIDKIDIGTRRLLDLRRSLSIIPQDSYLFLGTVRENLDPLKEYLDERIWEVLEDSNLKETVEGLEDGLSSKVSEGGSNFSGGQKQLLCLARALLKDSKVLILDEATASVDSKTDQLVQEVIKKKASNKTVITIAHRTDTVLDSDKILALEDGKVVEFDAPGILLKDPSSLFYRLIEAKT